MRAALGKLRVRLLALAVITLVHVGNLVRRGAGAPRDGFVLLVGAYGNGNYGDDAIGIAIADSIRSAGGDEVRIVGRRSDGKRLGRATGASFSEAGDGFRGILTTFAASRGAGAVVLGGGGLFEGKRDDARVHRLVLEYAGKLAAARLRGTPTLIHGVGISPDLYTDPWVSRAVAAVLRHSGAVTVRDHESAAVLVGLGIDHRVVLDPAVPLLRRWAAQTPVRPGTVGFAGLDRHRWPDFRPGADGPAREAELASLVTLIASRGEEASALELHPFHLSDCSFLAEIAGRLRDQPAGLDPLQLEYPLGDVEEAFARWISCERIVTMRFHPALAGLAAGRDVEIVGDLHKLAALRKSSGGRSLPELEDPDEILGHWLGRRRRGAS